MLNGSSVLIMCSIESQGVLKIKIYIIFATKVVSFEFFIDQFNCDLVTPCGVARGLGEHCIINIACCLTGNNNVDDAMLLLA